MTRKLFCHESELLKRFVACETVSNVSWHEEIVSDDFPAENSKPTHRKTRYRQFNVDVRSSFSQAELPEKFSSKRIFVHPGHTMPGIFVVVDMDTAKVHWLDFIFYDLLGPTDYPNSVHAIEACADAAAGNRSFKASLLWWRVFAEYDRVFFLVSTRDFESMCHAERKPVPMAEPLHGKCLGLYEESTLIGLDGWFVHPTGFGLESCV